MYRLMAGENIPIRNSLRSIQEIFFLYSGVLLSVLMILCLKELEKIQ